MYKHILIVVDQRPESQAAILEGTALAASQGSEVHFFCVLPRYSVPAAEVAVFDTVSIEEFQRTARGDADKALTQACKVAGAAGLTAHRAAGSGDDDARSIISHALERGCELIVVATEGRNALMRMLTGSAVPGLITASPIPVLICRGHAQPEPTPPLG